MDNEQPAPAKQAKIIDELPTIIGSAEPLDTTSDFSRYELDSQNLFSIYKVGEEKEAPKEIKEKDIDFNDPNSFLIQSESVVGGDNRHYVDLDFDLNPPAIKPTSNPSDSQPQQPTAQPPTTTIQPKETSVTKETLAKNLNDDDSFSEYLKSEQIDNLFDEKMDLIDMSASIISQSENSSFSDNIEFPSSTSLNVENKPTVLESTKNFDITTNFDDFDQSTPTASQSQTIENTTLNYDVSHVSESSSSSASTQKDASKHEQTATSPSLLDHFKPDSPQQSNLADSLDSKVLNLNEPELASFVEQHSSLLDNDDFVSETHFEPNIPQVANIELPEDLDYITKLTSVPSTIPEEDIVEEVSTSFSSPVFLERLPEALQAEQVILPDSNHESDRESPFVDPYSDSSKEQIKLSKSTSSTSNEAIFGTGSSPVPSAQTISEAKTVDVQPGYVEEFVINRSPAQQFVEEETVKLESQSLAEELSFQHQSTFVDQSYADEPIFAASAPVLSTFALPKQKQQTELSSFLDDANASTGHITAVSSGLVQQKADSPVASPGNTLPSDFGAQVFGDEYYADVQSRPTAVDLKKDQLDNDLTDDTVAVSVDSAVGSVPVAESLSSPPSPPPSPTCNVTTATPQLEEYSPVPVPAQQHFQSQQQQQTQPEHEDIISATSSTNLLHTSSPANITADQQQQVLSALREEAEEEEPLLQEQDKKKTWSRDNKEEAEASAPKAQEVVASSKKNEANTLEQWSSSSSSSASPLQSAASTTVAEPKTCPALSLASSPAPDTSTTMGRKNNQFRRENSNDEQEYSGPDQLKEFIQGVLGLNVAELVYWRDPKNTGVVFGIGLVILLSLSIFSVISVVAYTLLFTLLGTLSFRVYKNVLQAVQKTSEGHPFKEYLDVEINPSKERINEIVEQLVSHGTCFVNRMRSVLLVEDIVDSLKYLLIFWALTYIGAWFNGLTLVILSYISAFSLPKVYELNKTTIDQYIDLVNSKLTEISDKVPFLKKVPVEKKEE